MRNTSQEREKMKKETKKRNEDARQKKGQTYELKRVIRSPQAGETRGLGWDGGTALLTWDSNGTKKPPLTKKAYD